MSRSRHGARHAGASVSLSWQATLDVKTRFLVGFGAMSSLGQILVQAGVTQRALLLHQKSIKPEWVLHCRDQISAQKYEVDVLELPDDGEACKSTDQLLSLWDLLQRQRFDRNCAVVALGGGALSDLSGFAASTYLRGLKLVLLPTTLLAQVDAAIGGKTGINLSAGKNLAGSFYFPRAVLIDPEYLATLPPEQFTSGLAEIVKYALIEDTVAQNTEYVKGPRPLLEILEHNLGSEFAYDDDLLPGIITACVKMKLSVVAQDPQESGLRRVLNLGHTLGHALEKASRYELSHGQAVSIGLVFATRLAVARKRLPEECIERVVRLLEAAGLPTEPPGNLSRQEIVTAIGHDKKRAGKIIRFVLPQDRLGLVDFQADLSLEEITQVL